MDDRDPILDDQDNDHDDQVQIMTNGTMVSFKKSSLTLTNVKQIRQ